MTVAASARPLHDEALDTGDGATLRSPAVLGDARVLDVVALYGGRGGGPGTLQLGGPGTLAVACAEHAADTAAALDPIHRAWSAGLLEPGGHAGPTTKACR